MEKLKKWTIKFNKTNSEEKETQINIDYSEKEVIIYTSNRDILLKIKNKIGEPSRVFTLKGLISGAEWRIPFYDKRTITSILSRPLLIGKRE